MSPKNDTDNIEEARQGYVYFHLKKEHIVVKAPTTRKDEVFKVKDDNIAETLRAAQLNWKLKVAKISEDEEAIKTAQSELNLLESQKDVLNYASGTRKRTRQDAKF
ncbi:Oidioi.mRNA.OKI2018_I69.PAR.g10709.t1.cds [Oikopleura dioica]|uniref:Oidioi.mRNA.OKI2018_I69.PAR.g10709.t1.cds n=1 Tax=Oikopleura dioica TaxID=34765 RepID=A0ABN7RW88_OIKDI|nr:Oidioi.mRNA.OKI2018_I69.PAR.g10709.t1.cds [Oikopleura dioica]